VSAPLLLAAVLVLKGATVHTAEGPAIPDGVVVVEDGKITAVGDADTVVPPGAKVVDLTGEHVAPAFFVPASLVGLVEIPAVRATVDASEVGEINPDARPEVAANFDSEVLPVTRSNGVLYAALTPTGSVLPGAASVVSLAGWTREDACLKCPAAVLVEWPELMIDRTPGALPPARAQERRRDEALRTISDAFRRAEAYRTAKAAEGIPGVPGHDDDAAMAALVPVLEGKIPLVVRAAKKTQMEAALRFVDGELKNEKVRLVFLGATDAPQLSGTLAARKIPVILDGVLRLPLREDEPYDAPYALAGILAKAGVTVAITSGTSPFAAATTRDLPNHAAMAAAFGLPPLEALRAVTLNPARIYGVDDRIGSLAPGKDASIAVWTGDPLQITSRLVSLYEKGEALDLADRQKRLWERYRNRPKPVLRAPPAPPAPAPPATASPPPR
jgi:imidazolonepropionase-like amidohydrolase